MRDRRAPGANVAGTARRLAVAARARGGAGSFATATSASDGRCDVAPCTGKIVTGPAPYHVVNGTHLERLAPGTYRIDVRVDGGKTGERRGAITVDRLPATGITVTGSSERDPR
jgi:hypothetical protein